MPEPSTESGLVHWIASTDHVDEVAWTEAEAREYREAGWSVWGPFVPLDQYRTLLENRMHLSRKVKRMRNALYAVAPLADVPGTPTVVRDNLRGHVREGLHDPDA